MIDTSIATALIWHAADEARANQLGQALRALGLRVTGAVLGGPAPEEVGQLVLVGSAHLFTDGWAWGPDAAAWVAGPGVRRVLALDAMPWSSTPLAACGVAAGTEAPLDALRASAPGVVAAAVDEPAPAYEDDAQRIRGERAGALARLGAAGEPTAGLEPGDVIGGGRFRLLARVGAGRSATAWTAWDRVARAEVAVRVLHPHVARQPGRTPAFLAGGRRASELAHPSLLAPIATGQAGALVWEAVAPLAPLHATDPWSALQAALELADALANAHERGVAHGAVRPNNVMRAASGRAVLVDLDQGVPADGTVFDAPERAPDGIPAPSADLWSLAMTVMALVAGRAPGLGVLRFPEREVGALPLPTSVRASLLQLLSWEPDARSSVSLGGALRGDLDVVRALADAAIVAGRLDVAITHHEQLAGSVPEGERPAVLERMAELHEARGATDLAAAAWAAAAAAVAPADAAPRVERLRALALTPAAVTALLGALRGEVGRGDRAHRAHYNEALANALQRAGDRAGARTAWGDQLDLHETPSQAVAARRALAALAREDGDVPAYVAHTTALLPHLSSEDRAAGCRELSAVLRSVGDLDAALEWTERAVALVGEAHPESVAALDQRLEDRARRGEWHHVVALLELKAGPQDRNTRVRTLLRAAQIARATGLDATAQRVLRVLTAEAPSFARALRAHARNNVAYTMIEAREPQVVDPERAALLERLCAGYDDVNVSGVEARERSADRLMLARRLVAVGRWADAVPHVDAALALAPANVALLRFAGPLYLDAGMIERARHCAAQLLDIGYDPEHPADLGRATSLLGDLDWASGYLAAARERFQEVIDVAPDRVDAWWGVARTALAARATGDPSTDRVPWLVTPPPRLTGYEAVARLLAALIEPAALTAVLHADPLGERLSAVATHPLHVALAVTELLRRRGLIDGDLLTSLAARHPAWAGAVAITRDLLAGVDVPDADQALLAWTRGTKADLGARDVHVARQLDLPADGPGAPAPRRSVVLAPPGDRAPPTVAAGAALREAVQRAVGAAASRPAPAHPAPPSTPPRPAAPPLWRDGSPVAWSGAVDLDGVRIFAAGGAVYVDPGANRVGDVPAGGLRWPDGASLSLGALGVWSLAAPSEPEQHVTPLAPSPATDDGPSPTLEPEPEAPAPEAPAPPPAPPVIEAAPEPEPPAPDPAPFAQPTPAAPEPTPEPERAPAIATPAPPPPTTPPPPAPATPPTAPPRTTPPAPHRTSPPPAAREVAPPPEPEGPPAPTVDHAALADLTDGPVYEASSESTTEGVTEYALPLVDGPMQPVAQLVWKEGSMEAIIPFATSEITIGTRPNDDIVLARRADEPARTLYRIFRKGEEFWAHDQRGGAPEAPRRLRPGELFTIGNQLFRLDVEEPERTENEVVPEATVEIRSGLRRGTKARVTKTLVVGSDEASDLCVPTDGALAPRHFEVTWRDGAFYLTHTAPIGSTAVNGTPVTERRLVGGDILLAGHTVFTFHLT